MEMERNGIEKRDGVTSVDANGALLWSTPLYSTVVSVAAAHCHSAGKV